MTHYTLKNRKYAIISTVLVIFMWTIIALIVDNSIKIPTPMETLRALKEIVSHEYFYIQLLSSMKRFLIGFGLSLILGVTLGMLSGFFTPIYHLLQPIVLTQRAAPTMGVILLALIWFEREVAPILVCVLVIFPIIYSAVVNSVRHIDKQLLEMTSIYELSRKRKFIHLYLPSIRSSLLSVASAAIGLNIKINLAAEVLSQPKYAIGTGFQMEKAALNTAGVFAWSIVAIALAGFFEYLIKIIFKKWMTKTPQMIN